ncbi:MAG: TIGR03936 family radical SAM-associated protein [Anaerovoracaceae bacterium]
MANWLHNKKLNVNKLDTKTGKKIYMNTKYILTFKKNEEMKFTSHLDLMRLFKRAFKRKALPLKYSEGFNPHPDMKFAQPLSLGYLALEEPLEFQLKELIPPHEIADKIRLSMPDGIELVDCYILENTNKSLASKITSAEYKITIPLLSIYKDINAVINDKDMNDGIQILEIIKEKFGPDFEKIIQSIRELFNRSEIFVTKQQKFKNTRTSKGRRQKRITVDKSVNISAMIRSYDAEIDFNNLFLVITVKLDAGSVSNLSPELLIKAILSEISLPVEREDIEVTRIKLNY